MKSNKQRRKEIKAHRLKRTKKLVQTEKINNATKLPFSAISADCKALQHNNSYCLPLFYVDKPFVCKDCGIAQIWTAQQQKWWYEVAKGDINSTAIRCRSCRCKEQQRRAEARRVHFQGLAKKQLTNQNRYTSK
jgi:hypothetical protein